MAATIVGPRPSHKGPLTMAASEIPSRVLCTIVEEEESVSKEEALLDDEASIGLDLYFACKVLGDIVPFVELGDTVDDPNPICSLP